MTKDGVYFKKLMLQNVKCFRGTKDISFTKPNGEAQQWNVILGNNNTGKTTILKVLASLKPTLSLEETNRTEVNNDKNIILVPAKNIDKELSQSYRIRAFLGELGFWGFDAQKNENGENWMESHRNAHKGKVNIENWRNLNFIGYGISRKISDSNFTNAEKEDSLKGIFEDDVRYTNVEEWLLQLDLVAVKGDENSKKLLDKVKEILTSELLPDVKDIELISKSKDNKVENYALFHTDYGKVRLRELGYGYQSTMVWVVDLAKKMFERFYKLENPLHGTAICLVDEIDLHLHPDWQRKIIKYLSGVFPNVQFIVTAHSPLIVQSAEDVNLIILEKDKENTHIRQEFGTFQGWTVEEILQDLMGLGEKTLSDTYLNFLKQFETGIDEENYYKAKSAFDELNKILHPTSSQRKLLKLQLGSIAPLPASTFA